MRIDVDGLIWLEQIVEKLWIKHAVDISEVREVLLSKPMFRFVERGNRKNEDVYAALGRTDTGRYLIILGKDMSERKTSLSKASNPLEAGEFWDDHDLGEPWDETRPVDGRVNLRSERFLYHLEGGLARKIAAVARAQGVSSETLVNLWLQEKLAASGA